MPTSPNAATPRERSEFLLQVGELVRQAEELGLSAVLADVPRRRRAALAIDLQFFRSAADGRLRPVSSLKALQPLGDSWEASDPRHRWGGLVKGGDGAVSFESVRARPQAVRSGPVTSAMPVAARTASGAGLVSAAVGLKCANLRDDVQTVQLLLNLCGEARRVVLPEGPLKPDGAFGRKTADAVMAFQHAVLGPAAADGRVDAGGRTLRSLCESLPDLLAPRGLALLCLRAADADITEFAPRLRDMMTRRGIDTPLRQAHFLAQIGHESGEFRFRAEIASGQAYEGRQDLGNTQPGDGPRFKGRGLIQLTGRANYAEYGRDIGREAALLKQPQLVETDPALCVDVAGWFWGKRKLNALADADDLNTLTKRINGGFNGLDDRRRLLLRAKALLGL
jgi:predicted chitinase